MKYNLIKFFKKIFPFLAVLVLWRLSVPFWNPAGILALIPIFYYSFVKPINGFGIYSLIFCFLLDYEMNSVLYWTFVYCFSYALNGFQNFIDLSILDKNAFVIFMAFFGITILILSFMSFNLSNIFESLWIFCWVCVLYIPITNFMKKVCDDR